MMFFDTAGQEQYNSLSTSYVVKADYCIVMYAVDNEASIKAMPAWTEFVKRNNPHCKMILVGNKCDLKSVDESPLEELKSNFIKCVKCSAKTGEGVAEVLDLDYEAADFGVQPIENEKNKSGCC